MARKREKLREVEAIASRGSVSQFKVLDMGAEISELDAKQEDLRVAVAQAQAPVEMEPCRPKHA